MPSGKVSWMDPAWPLGAKLPHRPPSNSDRVVFEQAGPKMQKFSSGSEGRILGGQRTNPPVLAYPPQV